MLNERTKYFGLISITLTGLLALAACGQETTTPEVQDDIYSGFEMEEAAPEEVAEDLVVEAPVLPSETVPAEVAAGENADGSPIPNYEAEDVGEDLYRRGYPLDAMALWEANAEAGDSYAAYRLGVEYFDALHVERDVELSVRYQTLAAELGHPAAMFELASFIEAGLGVRQDMAQAGNWFLASAQRGFGPAQHNVATMFEDGVGQPQDLVQAYLYYSLAEAQGFTMNFQSVHEGGDETTYVPPIARLQEVLTEAQLLEAQGLVDNFVPLD